MDGKYLEKQKAVWILAILIVVIIIEVFAYLRVPQEEMNLLGFIIVLGTMLLIGLLFFQLRTTVDSEKIEISFGIGLIKKKISLKDIENVKVVRNKWYYGWGIRYFGNGWMWNIWGLDAVELSFTNKKKCFRIGSQQATKLKSNIESKLKTR